jgi:integrase
MREHPKPPSGTKKQALQRTDTPGVYRRGESYVTTWRRAGRQHKASFATLAEAREAKAAHERGERPAAMRVSFERYALEWIDTYRGRTRRGLAHSTRADYRRSLELYAVPYFAKTRMAEISPRDVRGYVEHLELLGQAASSVRKNFAPVRAMLATAVEEGVIAANPASVIRVVTARVDWGEPGRKALTRSELAAFLAATPEEWVPFFQLLVQSGLRISEAIGLNWSDLDLDAAVPTLSVRRQIYRGRVGPPKTRYGRRTIPLSTGMTKLLLGIRGDSAFGRDDDPVFASPRGTPLDVSNLRVRVLRPTAEQAGLEPLGFHVFRHTCASLLFDAGRNIKQIQEWLGHHDPGFTLSTYVHLVDQGLGDADFLDEAVAPVSGAAVRVRR